LIWGTRVSLLVGIAASVIAAFFGSLIGLVAGYAGGRTDNFIMRGIDMLMAFPYILLALAIVAVLGPGLMNALYAIAVVNIPFFARNVRGVTLALARGGVCRRSSAVGQGPSVDPCYRGPPQRPSRHRHHHVNDGRLDDPGDSGAQLPRAWCSATAGGSRLHARGR